MSELRDAEETLRLVEALLEGATTDGEREAARRARERMLAKLDGIRAVDRPREFRFSMPDEWSRRLLVALFRRYGLEPYRKHRQRYTTVMARAPKRVIDEIVWPEFCRIQDVLAAHLKRITDRVIAEALESDGSDASVVDEHPRQLGS